MGLPEVKRRKINQGRIVEISNIYLCAVRAPYIFYSWYITIWDKTEAERSLKK